MSVSTALLVAAGAGAGSTLRYLAEVGLRARTSHPLPWAILAVNVVGSFVLGWLAGAGQTNQDAAQWAMFLGAGLCGGLTTFSAFALQTDDLVQREERQIALVYVALTLILGLGAAWLGAALGG